MGTKDELQAKLDEQELAEEQDDELDEVDETVEWTPPTKEEWDKLQGKLNRANKQAQKLRESSRNGKVVDEDEEKNKQHTEELTRWQLRAIRSDAKSGLLERGADPDMVELALGKLKPSDIEFNDDDDPELEDWLDDMEERYPKLFSKVEEVKPKAQRKPNSIDQGAGNTGKPTKPKQTMGEMLVSRGIESARGQVRRPRS